MGDLQKSPLRDRLFAVVDSTHAKGLQAELVAMGLPPSNFVAWDNNGIEYVYPRAIMMKVFRCTEDQLSHLRFMDDLVCLNGIEMRKKDLCREVVQALDLNSELPKELKEKLLTRLASAIG